MKISVKKTGRLQEGKNRKQKGPADYDIYTPEPGERNRVLILAAAFSCLCGYLYFHSWIVSAAAGLLSVMVLPVYKKIKINERKNDLRLQFRDVLYSVSASVNTGRSLEEALHEAYDPVVLIYGEKCHMAGELFRINLIIEETNCSAEPLLKDLAKRCHIDEISEFVDVCTTCRRTGGDIGALIGKASSIITQNLELAREKHVLLSQKQLESRLLALMPPLIIFFINMSSSDYLTLMYTTLEGRLIMSASLVCTLGSFLWSFRLISFD